MSRGAPGAPAAAPIRPIQYFSDEYLARCRTMKPEEILEFLETFRLLRERTPTSMRLISLKVPEDLLRAFQARCRLEGLRYQTQIKRIMAEWLQPSP